MKTCETCKLWKRGTDYDVNRGTCSCLKFIDISEICDDDDLDGERTDTLCLWDAEQYKASFDTGKDFGCIHHSEVK